MTLTVAWAFFSGPTRYLSLATGAFFGLGAYVTAIGGKGLAWPLPVVAGAVVGAAMALIVGALALRLRGPYFAVFTFGLAELTKHIMALVGGAGTVAGPVVGAVFLGLASEILLLKFRYVYMLALGVTLIVVVLLLPSGLAGLTRRSPRSLAGGPRG